MDSATRNQAIKTSEQAGNAAIMTEIGNQMEALPRVSIGIFSKSVQHLHPYAMQVLMWKVYFNGFYAKREFCTLIGMVDSHHNVRYAMYILVEFGMICRHIHDNCKDLYGLGPSLSQYVISNTAPIKMVNYYLKEGRGIIGASSITLAESKKANTASRKRKYKVAKNGKAATSCTTNNVPKADNGTNDTDTIDNKAAAGNGFEASEVPSSPESTSAIYDL